LDRPSLHANLTQLFVLRFPPRIGWVPLIFHLGIVSPPPSHTIIFKSSPPIRHQPCCSESSLFVSGEVEAQVSVVNY